MNRFFTVLKTELKLSFRGMDMIIFALCIPAVAAVILGAVYGNRAAALSTIAVCAGGVMGLPLLISDYRQKRILKRYKVTPASPAFLLAVWVAIYAVYSLLSLALVFGILSLFFGCRFRGSFGIFLITYILVMLSMFSIGLMVGGIAPDMKTASVTASVLYFPMLIFSGATCHIAL